MQFHERSTSPALSPTCRMGEAGTQIDNWRYMRQETPPRGNKTVVNGPVRPESERTLNDRTLVLNYVDFSHWWSTDEILIQYIF